MRPSKFRKPSYFRSASRKYSIASGLKETTFLDKIPEPLKTAPIIAPPPTDEETEAYVRNTLNIP